MEEDASVTDITADSSSTSIPEAEEINDDVLEDFRHFAANEIQRIYRGYRTRKLLAALKEQQLHEEAGICTPGPLQQYQYAAFKIQSAWRGYCNRKIFEFYRDLVASRQAVEPRELLRGINPREAQLVDAAAGLHVRLRLGGSMFPPLLFYKIFTHRPVADINAFCPRDYAAEALADRPAKHAAGSSSAAAGSTRGGAAGRQQQQEGQQQRAAASSRSAAASSSRSSSQGDFRLDDQLRHYRKRDGSVGYRPRRGWYERIENNGWRPVAERLLLPEDKALAAEASRQQQAQRERQEQQQQQHGFHHSTAVRREEKAQRAKQRRRQWLMKLHRQGMLASAAGLTERQLEEQLSQQEQVLAQQQQQRQQQQQDIGPDPELDLPGGMDGDLLSWSAGLDFDSYVAGWSSLAVTLPSEVQAVGPAAFATAAAMLASVTSAASIGGPRTGYTGSGTSPVPAVHSTSGLHSAQASSGTMHDMQLLKLQQASKLPPGSSGGSWYGGQQPGASPGPGFSDGGSSGGSSRPGSAGGGAVFGEMGLQRAPSTGLLVRSSSRLGVVVAAGASQGVATGPVQYSCSMGTVLDAISNAEGLQLTGPEDLACAS